MSDKFLNEAGLQEVKSYIDTNSGDANTIESISVNGTAVSPDANKNVALSVPSVSQTSVTIATSDWSNKTCTKNVTGVTANNTVIVSYAPSSKDAYQDADIYCSAQGAGTLTFTCETVPSEAVTVNVAIMQGGA